MKASQYLPAAYESIQYYRKTVEPELEVGAMLALGGERKQAAGS